jgi:hypothetical protein
MINTILLMFLWACYAIRRQEQLYGGTVGKYTLVFVLNFIFCPVCMLIAIVKGR